MSEIACDFFDLYPLFTSIPGRYARALINVGIKNNCIDEIEQNFNILLNFIHKNKKHAKNNIVYVILKFICKNCNKFFANFITILIKNKKLSLLNNIQYIFHRAYLKNRGEREVIVKSAFSLNSLEQKKVKSLINKLFNEKLIIKYETDKNILTGIKLQSGGLVFDASGKTIIQQLSSYSTMGNIKYE